MPTRLLAAASSTLLAILLAAPVTPVAAQAPAAPTYNVPVTYYTLPNGLKVVLSRDVFDPAERDRIAETNVELTVVGGRVAFER